MSIASAASHLLYKYICIIYLIEGIERNQNGTKTFHSVGVHW